MADIRIPNGIIVTGERALVHYDLFAISRVLPTVPRIRLSCIFCTWFPLRRSEDTPVEHPGREPGSTGQGGKRQRSEIRSRRAEDEIAGFFVKW